MRENLAKIIARAHSAETIGRKIQEIATLPLSVTSDWSLSAHPLLSIVLLLHNTRILCLNFGSMFYNLWRMVQWVPYLFAPRLCLLSTRQGSLHQGGAESHVKPNYFSKPNLYQLNSIRGAQKKVYHWRNILLVWIWGSSCNYVQVMSLYIKFHCLDFRLPIP